MATASASMRVDQRGTVSVKSRNMMVNMPEVGVWQDAELIDPDGMVDNEKWQWEISPHVTESERVWIAVPGTQSRSYKPVEGDAGKILRMTVTYDDGAGSGKRAISPSTKRVDQPGTVDLSTYTELAVGKEVIATLSDLDEAANEKWQWHSSPKQDQAVWVQALSLVGNAQEQGWPLAYVLAWLSVAGTNSVMPPWVLFQFPEASRMVKKLRDTPCQQPAANGARSATIPPGSLAGGSDSKSSGPSPPTLTALPSRRRLSRRPCWVKTCWRYCPLARASPSAIRCPLCPAMTRRAA